MKTILMSLTMFAAIAAGQSKDCDPLICNPMKPTPPHAWNYSVAFLASAETSDALSSRGLYERNPILGRSAFGARQELIKGGLIGALVVSEWLIVRHHPSMRKGLTVANYAVGGVTFGVAAYNWRMK